MAMSSTNSTEGRRAVGYVRISKDRANETSTGTQEERIRAYCQAQGVLLVDVVVESGRSAFKDNRNGRPGLRKALDLIEGGAADELVVWKIDRCSRNTLDLLTLVRDLESKGAAFASVTEQFDTSTAMGRAMLTIVGALAELESANKSERGKVWHEHRKVTAAAPAAQPPRGYTKPGRNLLAIDPIEGPLIAAAAERIASGASLRSTVRHLNEAGLTMTHTGLRKCLTSPTVAGLVEVADGALVAGSWPALIDPEQWAEVRSILGDAGRTTNHSGGRRRFALAGIARCACGGTMRGKAHPKGERLVCNTCGKGIRHAEVESFVSAAVLDALNDRAWRRLRAQGRGKRIEAAEIEAKLAELWEMVLADDLPVEDYRQARTRWEGELAAADAAPLDLPDVDSLRSSWDDLGVEARRLVYVAAIESLVIMPAVIGVKSVDESRIKLALVV